MKTIQITIEDKLLEDLDAHLNGQSRARSAFIRDSIEKQLRRERIKELERREIEAYTRIPQTEEELSFASNTDDWGPDEDFSHWRQNEPR